MNSAVIPAEFDYSPFDFQDPPKDIASINFLIATQKLMHAQSNEKIKKPLSDYFEELFEKKMQ